MSDVAEHRLAVTAPGVAWVGIDSEVVVRDANGGIHLLDARAALVWAHVDGERTCSEIAHAVAICVPETSVPQRNSITADVLTLLESLSELGLVLIPDAGQASQASSEN